MRPVVWASRKAPMMRSRFLWRRLPSSRSSRSTSSTTTMGGTINPPSSIIRSPHFSSIRVSSHSTKMRATKIAISSLPSKNLDPNHSSTSSSNTISIIRWDTNKGEASLPKIMDSSLLRARRRLRKCRLGEMRCRILIKDIIRIIITSSL